MLRGVAGKRYHNTNIRGIRREPSEILIRLVHEEAIETGVADSASGPRSGVAG